MSLTATLPPTTQVSPRTCECGHDIDTHDAELGCNHLFGPPGLTGDQLCDCVQAPSDILAAALNSDRAPGFVSTSEPSRVFVVLDDAQYVRGAFHTLEAAQTWVLHDLNRWNDGWSPAPEDPIGAGRDQNGWYTLNAEGSPTGAWGFYWQHPDCTRIQYIEIREVIVRGEEEGQK